ncbi:hypothetical protein CMU25_01555 [Elizabethkingia anophelis]|nr:hypothetical protein [Elizabethkingia anophelis]MDV3839025.1 hypothetical protein [Elizabethkingia anophelis]
MKTLLLTILLISGIAFGQSKDLTKKQAFDLYKKSNVRIALGYKVSDFNKIYNTRKSGLKINRESIILNNIKDKEEIKKIQWYYNFPQCFDCNTIIYESEKTAKEMVQWTLPRNN